MIKNHTQAICDKTKHIKILHLYLQISYILITQMHYILFFTDNNYMGILILN